MSGIGKVDAHRLEVVESGGDRGHRRAAVQVTDKEIQQALQMRLRNVPELEGVRIESQVDARVATLRGTVDTLQQERIARATAAQTDGVERVR